VSSPRYNFRAPTLFLCHPLSELPTRFQGSCTKFQTWTAFAQLTLVERQQRLEGMCTSTLSNAGQHIKSCANGPLSLALLALICDMQSQSPRLLAPYQFIDLLTSPVNATTSFSILLPTRLSRICLNFALGMGLSSHRSMQQSHQQYASFDRRNMWMLAERRPLDWSIAS